MKSLKKIWNLLIISSVLVLFALIMNVVKVTAKSTPPSLESKNTSDDCLTCHGQPGMQVTLTSGENLYLSIDAETYNHSVHGGKSYTCVQCHTNITGYPHPALTTATRREFSLQLSQVCANCHQDMFDLAVNDAHTQARLAGKQEAAVCTDCHGSHDVTAPDEPRSRSAQTCQRCHSQIFDVYKTSAHGAALIGMGNQDVPTCVNCHNAHNVQGPSNTQFRLFSPQICARCHENKALMDKYGINTDVFETYIADFHGTTVEIFQSVAPGQKTNKPVCIDCHGVHDMQKPGDQNDPAMKVRLLVICQKCHPGATANFPSAWMNHYRPSPEHYPIVYYVNLFYKFFIPGVLGGMAVFVVTDIGRRAVNSRKRAQPAILPKLEPLKRPSPPSAEVPTQPKLQPVVLPEAEPVAEPVAPPDLRPEEVPAPQPVVEVQGVVPLQAGSTPTEPVALVETPPAKIIEPPSEEESTPSEGESQNQTVNEKPDAEPSQSQEELSKNE